MAVVLMGAYEQTSYAGRFLLGAGDVILNPSFDSHSGSMLSNGVELIRLPWRREFGFGGVFDDLPVDDIRHAAVRDTREATALVENLIRGRCSRPAMATDYADVLGQALLKNPGLRICDWAEQSGAVSASISRKFLSLYGVTPARYRNEVRARAAWAKILSSREAMTTIAYDLEFADQAHMARDVKTLTGKSPSWWRALNSQQ